MPRETAGILTLFACVLASAAPAAAEWTTTFVDAFDGSALDRTRWKTADYWGNRNLPGNDERQCYRDDAFAVADGVLTIRATRRETPAGECHPAEAALPYASGMITTAGCNPHETGPACEDLERFTQAYGYFEMRARLPAGKGFWPAFWLLPEDGAWPPEIDVLEWLGDDRDTAFMTYHYETPEGDHEMAQGAFDGPDFSEAFHRFGLLWTPDRLVWYVDGVERFRVEDVPLPDTPMYLLVNLAVGGTWPGEPDETTPFPAAMEIDRVRVHAWTGPGDPPGPPDPEAGER
jgi:beta-glucanase (GH16 family)